MEDINATYVFRVQYYDSQPDVTKDFLLFYYVETNAVELYDPKSRRLFLKKCKAPPCLQRQLYVSNTIQLVSRQLKIVDYGDERTRRLLSSKRISKVGIIVKPHAYKNVGEILQGLLAADLTLSYIHMSRTRSCDKAKLCHGIGSCARGTLAPREEDSLPTTLTPLIEIEVVGPEAKESGASAKQFEQVAYDKASNVFMFSDPAIAKQEAPASLRSLYGVSKEENVVALVGIDEDCSNLEDEASAEATDKFCAASRSSRSAEVALADCSCCIIKPSGMKHAGCILRDIKEAGFEICAMQSFHLTKNAANEFYEVYQHVLKEQPLMVEELTSGMCIAMRLEHPGKSTVKRLRELTGPFDSEMARALRPTSLRAKYGVDRVWNAVHCTDLPEDGELEVHYFFHVLADVFKKTHSSVS